VLLLMLLGGVVVVAVVLRLLWQLESSRNWMWLQDLCWVQYGDLYYWQGESKIPKALWP
jgi:hypothetical protein